MRRARARDGFTLIEALASLAVTGLVVSALFLVGSRGAFTGVRLGVRALDTIDANVGRTAWRDVVGDIVLPPVGVSSEAAEAEISELDDSFVGAPDQAAGWLIAGRDTPCAPVGASGRLYLYFERTDSLETTLYCQLDAYEPMALARLRWTGAQFSYSEDGVNWFDTWLVERGLPVENAFLPNSEQRKVLIRLTAADGRDEIIAVATSGRALPQVVPPDDGEGE